MSSGIDQVAYDSYFGKPSSDVSIPTRQKTPEVISYTQQDESSVKSEKARMAADENIDDIEQLGILLRRVLNAAWGDGWGILSLDYPRGEDPDKLDLPQITFDVNSREIAEKMPIKPTLTETVFEVVAGQKTGDAFNLYRQWFDCIVEFNFWGRTNLETRKLMARFEGLIGAYAGYLKRQGISEIFFLKEVNPRQSMHFLDGIPMRSLMYYIRLERISTVRLSTIKRIDLEVNAEPTVDIGTEPDIYRASNITYDL